MKIIRTSVLILCACFVSVARGQQPACYNSWAQFHRYNMQRWNRCEKVLTVTNVKNLALKWKYATGFIALGSPEVANGVVYIGSGAEDGIGNLYALNARTGALLWSYWSGLGNGVSSSPAVANGVVYVGSNDGNLYALNATTGALLWSYPVVDAGYSSPAVAYGVVYAGSNGNVYAPKCQHRRAAVELRHQRWR